MLGHWYQLLLNTPAAEVLASLGSWCGVVAKKEPLPEVIEEIKEPIPVSMVSRIREEFLSESFAQDLIARAKQRRKRDKESLLILLLL